MRALSQTNAGDTCTIKWMFGVPDLILIFVMDIWGLI